MSARLKWVFAGFAALLLGALLARTVAQPPERLIVLAIGQGNCILIQSGGRNVLYDAGPEGSGRLATNKLRSFGVRHLDLVILSHPDADHIAGLPEIASRFAVSRVMAARQFDVHPDLKRVLTAARIAESQMVWVDKPWTVRSGSWALTVTGPQPLPGEDDNAGSLFAHVAAGVSRALLTGDAPADVEDRMTRAGDWRADLLLAGHHGSATSTSEWLLQRVKPKTVAISCGIDNAYGHPADDLMSRLHAFKLDVARTDKDGDLIFRPTRRGFVRVRHP